MEERFSLAHLEGRIVKDITTTEDYFLNPRIIQATISGLLCQVGPDEETPTGLIMFFPFAQIQSICIKEIESETPEPRIQ